MHVVYMVPGAAAFKPFPWCLVEAIPLRPTSSSPVAALQVLAEAGWEGMHVEEIARQIQRRGFRDLRSSKTPEASGEG
jgi:hypothetical protein